jgi:hypothetical protein
MLHPSTGLLTLAQPTIAQRIASERILIGARRMSTSAENVFRLQEQILSIGNGPVRSRSQSEAPKLGHAVDVDIDRARNSDN